MPITPHGNAPYTTVTAAITAIEAFRDKGMGTPVTQDTLIRAGVPESLAKRTLSSLKALELLDAEGEPTQQFKDLRLARGDEEYRARLQEWVRGVYADVLQYTDPSANSPDRVAEAFRTYEPSGQRRGMAALLIGLWKHAGLPVPEGAAAPRATAARPRTARTPRPSARQQPRRSGNDPSTTPTDLPPGLVGLIQQIPHGPGASWTSRQRDGFLKAFEAALDFTVPVDDAPDSAEGSDD